MRHWPAFSVIIPTLGQRMDGLQRAVAALDQAGLDRTCDEVLLVADTYSAPVPDALAAFAAAQGPAFRLLECGDEPHCVGQPQRDAGVAASTKDYILFGNDDDCCTLGALYTVRAICASLPEPRPQLYRFVHQHGVVLWDTPGVLAPGHCSDHCICFPNDKDRLGRFGRRYEGDFDFIRSTVDKWGADNLLWRPEIIAVARPAR